jgi:hypothetical protein
LLAADDPNAAIVRRFTLTQPGRLRAIAGKARQSIPKDGLA